MDEYELTMSLPISTGEIVTIVIDEDIPSVIAFNADREKIGQIEFDGDGFCYKIVWMYFDQLSSKYTRKGIGRAALVFFKETYQCRITAERDDGISREDGSRLTGDGPLFISKMRFEGIVEQ